MPVKIQNHDFNARISWPESKGIPWMSETMRKHKPLGVSKHWSQHLPGRYMPVISALS